MGTDQHSKGAPNQSPDCPIDHDEHVVVSFEISHVREVLRHAFSSRGNRLDYRIPNNPAQAALHREMNESSAPAPERKPPDIWVVFVPELCLFSFKKGSPTVPIFLASSGSAQCNTVTGSEYVYPIQRQSDRVWGEVMDFMTQTNQGQGIFYALSSEEVRDHLDHRQAFMDVHLYADRIEWCTTPRFCLSTYSISEKR